MSRPASAAALLRDVRWPTTARGSRAGGRTLPMAQNSVALILAKVATMGLGFLFWLVAARLFAPSDVGLASGAVSAMMLITQLALFGVGSAVISLYPSRKEDPAALLDGALTIVSGAALLGGAIFIVLAATVLQNLHVVAEQPLFALGFALMCVLGTAGIVLDQTSTVLRRGDQVLVRGVLNGVVSLIGLPLVLLLPSGDQAQAIFDVWVFGAVVMCASAGLQLRRTVAGYRPRARTAGMSRELMTVGLPNHLLTLADRAPALLLPVLVTELLSPTQNAYWYAVWMMAWVVFVIPVQVGMTLFAEASHGSKPLGVLVRQGVSTRSCSASRPPRRSSWPRRWRCPSSATGYAAAGAGPLRILLVSHRPDGLRAGLLRRRPGAPAPDRGDHRWPPCRASPGSRPRPSPDRRTVWRASPSPGWSSSSWPEPGRRRAWPSSPAPATRPPRPPRRSHDLDRARARHDPGRRRPGAAGRVGRAPRRVSAGVVGPAGLVVVSLAFWALSLGRIDAADITTSGSSPSSRRPSTPGSSCSSGASPGRWPRAAPRAGCTWPTSARSCSCCTAPRRSSRRSPASP